jgi:hypothetical protein
MSASTDRSDRLGRSALPRRVDLTAVSNPAWSPVVGCARSECGRRSTRTSSIAGTSRYMWPALGLPRFWFGSSVQDRLSLRTDPRLAVARPSPVVPSGASWFAQLSVQYVAMARVLDADATPIPGLLAAGGAAAGPTPGLHRRPRNGADLRVHRGHDPGCGMSARDERFRRGAASPQVALILRPLLFAIPAIDPFYRTHRVAFRP